MPRESDLQDIGGFFGQGTPKKGRTPDALGPGVVLTERRHVVRDPETQEVAFTETYIEPQVKDYDAYYGNLDQHNARPEDETLCPRCKGAKYVRHANLVPGMAGFGMPAVCPNYNADQKRCVRTDSMGFQR